MTNQEIFELLSRLENSSIQSIRISRGDFSLEVSKAALQGQPTPIRHSASAEPTRGKSAAVGQAICAPLAGTFYAASEPCAKPYASAGDRVKAGQTVCLMEAMKMISEVPAPCDCVITEVLKENGKLAEYDEPLFRYQPC